MTLKTFWVIFGFLACDMLYALDELKSVIKACKIEGECPKDAI